MRITNKKRPVPFFTSPQTSATNDSVFAYDDTPVYGYNFGYQYDDIGNRTLVHTNLRESSYITNLANEYTQRSVPSYVDVRGKITSGTQSDLKVLVDDRLVEQNAAGEFYRATPVVAGESEVKIQGVAVSSKKVATDTRTVRLPSDPESFIHDKDGNLTQDGLWDYAWDGENRLSSMTRRTDVGDANHHPSPQRLLFKYDAQGRRIQKQVQNLVSGSWQTAQDLRYLYDGWNLLVEYQMSGSTFNVLRTYVWGLDLSNTMQGAGGVGGLLWTSASSSVYAPGYDGNGNITLWINLSNGSEAGRREYSPFGEDLIATGVGSSLPFGFSTKYTDSESGLCYYGYRYYSADTGRWLSRDPIEENGEVNLYAFVTNDPLKYYDYLGLDRRDRDDRDGRSRRRGGDFESDWAGRAILWRWLTAGGNWVIYDDPAWSDYMMSNDNLREDVESWLLYEAVQLRSRHGGGNFTERIDITRHGNLGNGEGVVGHQYLHQSNPSVGDFRIQGTIKGNSCRLDFDISYTWNDMIDPNPEYATDPAKALFGEIISIGNAEDYRIWITWHAKSKKYFKGPGVDGRYDEGWPFGGSQ